jgi:hypothetical protein
VLIWFNAAGAQPDGANSRVVSSPTPASLSAQVVRPAEITPVAPSSGPQATASTTAAAPHMSATPPSDVSSLTAKEILAANNLMIGNVAGMYQSLGLFITVIVTLVGGGVGVIAYVARKDVKEFIHEWDDRLKTLAKDGDDSAKRLRDLVAEAEKSANKAAEYSKSIEGDREVLNRALKDLDRFRAASDGRSDESGGGSSAAVAAEPGPMAAESEIDPEVTQEDAEVAARLNGKIEPRQT